MTEQRTLAEAETRIAWLEGQLNDTMRTAAQLAASTLPIIAASVMGPALMTKNEQMLKDLVAWLLHEADAVRDQRYIQLDRVDPDSYTVETMLRNGANATEQVRAYVVELERSIAEFRRQAAALRHNEQAVTPR